MRYILITILTVIIHLAAMAAEPMPRADYIYPVRGVGRVYSANFGEMRPNHFHSGIDIKTDGVTGKKVVAIADGYISRVVVQPSGYGRAIYITHFDGTTSVYGHLDTFRDDIEEYVRRERVSRRSNRVELFFDSRQWRVAQGDLIGFSGNTGQSFGPHLHFEIRESASQRTINLFRCGYITPDDDTPPLISRLHYIEVDTLHGVPIRAERKTFMAEGDSGSYRIADTIDVGRSGFFELETSDRKNGVKNTFGVYRVECRVHGEPIFEYRMDGFTFDRSKYCNAVASYDLQLDSSYEVIRLARIDGNLTQFYTLLKDDGVVRGEAGRIYNLSVVAEDDMGNCSTLEFVARGTNAEQWFVAQDSLATSEIINRNREFSHRDSLVSLTIPAGALYESAFYRAENGVSQPKMDTSLVVLSPCCSIMESKVPLHKSATLYINCDVPQHLQSKALLARVNHRGRVVSAAGRYADGRVGGKISTFGDYMVVADVTPPTIKPRFREGADLSNDDSVSFTVGDNFSGIASYEGTIDGKWVIFEYMPVAGRLIHYFRDSDLSKGRHIARMRVCDGRGNESVVERVFYR